MNHPYYEQKFIQAISQLDQELLRTKGIGIDTGSWLESVVLRLQKKHWANKPYNKPQREAAIFFSIWLSDEGLKKNRIFYNIHALKLRQLKDYKLTAREFAASFRKQFKKFEHQWPNVSTNYGPLNLMEGWLALDEENLVNDIAMLATKFLTIDFIIDDLLKISLK